jgi:hypothetical protein
MRDPISDDDDSWRRRGQDLLVVLALSNKAMGTSSERAEIAAFADQLEAAVTEAGVGEYDGDEFGGGECTLVLLRPRRRSAARRAAAAAATVAVVSRGASRAHGARTARARWSGKRLPIRGDAKA